MLIGFTMHEKILLTCCGTLLKWRLKLDIEGKGIKIVTPGNALRITSSTYKS